MSYGNINYKWEKRGYPLTLEEIGCIRQVYYQGKSTTKQLAIDYRVSYRTIESVVKRLFKYANI